MSEKQQRRVLIVDDEQAWHDIFRRRFGTCGHRADCPYEFSVDVASSLAEGVDLIRTAREENRAYDVLVFDLIMEVRNAGLCGVAGIGLDPESPSPPPVIIVLTGYPTYETCVRAIRDGAWDYVAKEDTEDRPAAQAVVDSAVARLRELDLRWALRHEFTQWFPGNAGDLRAHYPAGSVVALWNDPEMHVVAAGTDSFDLEQKLQAWRGNHEVWQQPYVIQVPGASTTEEREA